MTDDALRILFICTANMCRSPLAEVIAKDQLDRRGIAAKVSSAGFHEGGRRAARGALEAAQNRGLDLSSHVSRQITPEIAAMADVVIAMEPTHIFDLAEMMPATSAWSLTLKELVTFGESRQSSSPDEASRGPMSPSEILDWVHTAGARDLGGLLSRNVTIKDPMGQSPRAFRNAANEISDLLASLFACWFQVGQPAR